MTDQASEEDEEIMNTYYRSPSRWPPTFMNALLRRVSEADVGKFA